MSQIAAGPLVARVTREQNYPTIMVTCGSFELTVAATPGGRKVFLTIEDGDPLVVVARWGRDGHWLGHWPIPPTDEGSQP